MRNTRPAPRFCSSCGEPLRAIREHGIDRVGCGHCGLVSYRNPVPACGVIVERAGSVLLAKRAHAPRKHCWGFPAGFMEYGEDPESTAIREAKEETGLSVELEKLFGVYSGRDDPRTDVVLILYEARAHGRLRAGDDASDVGYFALDRLPQPIAFGAHREALRDLRRSRRSSGPSRGP